jgi:hypothetical protein
MSTALRISTSRSGTSRRVPLLASASGLIAAASIAVTLIVAGGGDSASRPSAAPASATPDRATLYQRGAEVQRPGSSIAGQRSAERFHHFR